MSERTDPERVVEEAVQEADPGVEEMSERSERLEEEIDETRAGWKRLEQDESVPGAQEPMEEQETERQDLGEQPGGSDR